jgi:hypothetical protein
MSDTPRTDAAEIISMHPNDLLGWPEGRKTGVVPKSKMKELERELAEAREQRDRLALICGELIAAVRINSMRDTFCEATREQIEIWLKQWVDKLAAAKGGGE